VIVPGFGRLPRADDTRLFLWMEQPRAEGDDLLLAPIQETGAEDDPIYRWVRKLEAEKERLEFGRVLYVAATRARERLHLLGDVRLAADADGAMMIKPPGKRTLLGQLWPAVEPAFRDAVTRTLPPGAAEQGAPDAAIDQSLRRIASGWQAPVAPPRVKWVPPQDALHARDELEFSWVGETARLVGSVVHRWLQRIADDGLAAWDAQRIRKMPQAFEDELVACGLPFRDVTDAAARVAASLEQTLTDERGRWLLRAREDAQSELRLTGVTKDGIANVVVDRTFVDEQGTRWIVDYKTSGHEGGDIEAFLDREEARYRPQLERYAALLMSRDNRPVRLGLYFPLLKGWRELKTKG
jgi:ATP-dependent exoDNAse (exonuclease V) beta subunit